MWKNISDTIKYKDGTTVKLKAGQFSVIRPSEKNPFYGYQIHYFCPGGYSRTFGLCFFICNDQVQRWVNLFAYFVIRPSEEN